ncbi:MAG: hypothetical protein ACYTEQ_27395 [Planctomycetota bacterium]|jgi:hypothetical protein
MTDKQHSEIMTGLYVIACALGAICGILLFSGCGTIRDWRDDLDDFKEWDKLSIEDVWDKLRGKEVTTDNRGWSQGPHRIDVAGKPAEWEWVIQTKDIPKDRPPNGKPERGFFELMFDKGKVYQYVMPDYRNCFRIRAKGGTNFNVHCKDKIYSPIPDGESEWRVTVEDDLLDITLDGVPIGRKDRSRGIKNHYLPIKLNGARLKHIVIDNFAGDGRVFGGWWKAREVKAD